MAEKRGLRSPRLGLARYSNREIIPAEDYTAFYADRRRSRLTAARPACIAQLVNGPIVLAVDFCCPTLAMPDGQLHRYGAGGCWLGGCPR